MYCRSRPQYRSNLGWILGVAFLGTLTRSARPVRGFTFVQCCSTPRASSPHGLAARAVAVSLRLLPTRSAEDLHLLSRGHAWHTKLAPLGLAWAHIFRRRMSMANNDFSLFATAARCHSSAKLVYPGPCRWRL